MKLLSFLTIAWFQANLCDALGPVPGYSQLTLTNPRYEDGIYHPSYLQPDVVIDGRVDWDDSVYTQAPWNPSAMSSRGGTTSSMNANTDFYVDLESKSQISMIKIYPRQDCCFHRYWFWTITIYDPVNQGGTGVEYECTTNFDLAQENIPNYFYTGIEWNCPLLSDDPGSIGAGRIRIQAGGDWVQMTEIEAFIGSPIETLYQPENLVFRNYAPDLLHQFVNRSTIITDVDQAVNNVLTHGCWCAKLDKQSPYLEFLGGPDAVDELDEICRGWFKCRNCNDRLQGGSCNVQYSSSMELLKAKSYVMQSDPTGGNFIDTVECAVEGDDCADDSCTIDLYYLKSIFNYLEDNFDSMNPLLVNDNSTCTAAVNTDKTRICTGYAPYLTPVVENAQQYIDSGWVRPPVHCNTGNPHAGTDVVYRLMLHSADWHYGQNTCENIGDGATLARIFCDSELSFLSQIAVNNPNGNNPVFIGGNDINGEGNWRWAESDGSDGIRIEGEGGWNIPWNTGQPDNAGGIEDCMEINRWAGQPYINDIPCNYNLGAYICEKRFGVTP